jgi:hypothetical protein
MIQANSSSSPPITVSIPTPAGHDADWDEGFVAGVAAARGATGISATASPGTPSLGVGTGAGTTPVAIAGLTIRTVQPDENLVAILNAAVDGQQFRLVAGATYTPVPLQVAPKARDWALDATGATIDWTLPPSVATACFRLGYNGVTITGGTWKTNAVFVEVLAQGCQFTASTILDGATSAVKIDAFGGNSGAGAIVQGNSIGITASVSIYSTQPCQIRGNTLAGSIGEVPLRIDCDGAGVSPSNVIIDGNTLRSIAAQSSATTDAANMKGAAELRELGTGCQFTNNTVFDYVRVGQGSASAPTQFANGLLISGNNWPTLPPTNVQEHLMLMAGVTADVESNDFLVNAIMQVASVSAPTAIAFKGNRRHPCAPGIVPRPQLWDPVNNRAGGIPVDAGGNVVG